MRIKAVLALLALLPLGRAEDWPQFLGPNRDGTSAETIAGQWKAAEPKRLWKYAVGAGFAGPTVVAKRVFVFHRRGTSEILEALDAQTGQPEWKNEQPTSYEDDFGFDEGPRAVPCVAGGEVYVMGAEGTIRCVDTSSGKTVWVVRTKEKFGARKGFFGMACSPLVQGETVIANIGGDSGAGIVALDRKTGALRWKSRGDEASYSSPVTAMLEGREEIVAFTREAVSILNPQDGRELAEFPWRSRMSASVNAATPLVSGNLIFVTASYGTGAALLEFRVGALKKVWSGDESLSSHYATPVLHRGYLFGYHGRQEYGPSLRCVELKTGRVLWDEERFGAGTVTRVGDNLLLLRESGELVIAKASPDKFVANGQVQILGFGTRAYPAISEHHLYARDKSSLVCVQLP